MSGNRIHAALGVFAITASLSGCASTGPTDTPSMASAVAFDDQWANSADTGMAAVFGTFTNAGGHDAVIVSGESPAAARVEIHEVVHEAGASMTMRPKEGGIVVPAGGAAELEPGGDHLMLMDLSGPLQPGADVSITVTFEDGSTLPITAQIRDFAGGDENYSPGPHGHG
jgi:periplasmic copper chaperone A